MLLFDHPSQNRVWIVAAGVALFGHLACAALAVAWMSHDADEDDLGAPGIEIAVDLTSPTTEPTELPPGPEAEASAASPPVVQQTETKKKNDLPQDTPDDMQPPDRVVALDKSDKPDDQQPEPTVKKFNPSEASTAQLATAMPTVPHAAESVKSRTVDQGTGASLQRARVTWQKELLAHLDRYKRYPGDRSQKAARIVLALKLDRDGHVLSAKVATSSGDDSFDRAALSMIEHANPVPAPPPLVADQGLIFALPVIFHQNGK
jgi:protein TonB